MGILESTTKNTKWVSITKDFITANKRVSIIKNNRQDSTTMRDFTTKKMTDFIMIKTKKTDFIMITKKDSTTRDRKMMSRMRKTNPMSMSMRTNTKLKKSKFIAALFSYE